jgi:hypothetical protein
MVSKTAELVASSPITRTPIVGAKNSIVGVKNSVGTRERLSNHINSSIFIDLATIWVILLHPPPFLRLRAPTSLENAWQAYLLK